jgi:hypothetical protein
MWSRTWHILPPQIFMNFELSLIYIWNDRSFMIKDFFSSMNRRFCVVKIQICFFLINKIGKWSSSINPSFIIHSVSVASQLPTWRPCHPVLPSICIRVVTWLMSFKILLDKPWSSFPCVLRDRPNCDADGVNAILLRSLSLSLSLSHCGSLSCSTTILANCSTYLLAIAAMAVCNAPQLTAMCSTFNGLHTEVSVLVFLFPPIPFARRFSCFLPVVFRFSDSFFSE